MREKERKERERLSIDNALKAHYSAVDSNTMKNIGQQHNNA